MGVFFRAVSHQSEPTSSVTFCVLATYNAIPNKTTEFNLHRVGTRRRTSAGARVRDFSICRLLDAPFLTRLLANVERKREKKIESSQENYFENILILFRLGQ